MKETNDTSELRNSLTIVSKEKDKFEKSSLHFAKIEMIDELKKKIRTNYKPDEAEDSLVYGLAVSLLTTKNKIKEGFVRYYI